MTAYSATITHSPINDNTSLRAWGSALSAGWAAIGLVKTADTGQVDWTSVAFASASAAVGYEIWRFNDTLQATKPIYLKITYTLTSNQGYLSIAIASGSNGAGTLTGIVSSTQALNGTVSAGTYAFPHLWSGDGSSFVYAGAFGHSSNGAITILVSRTQNSDGTYNGDGLWAEVHSGSSGSAASCMCMSFTSNSYTGWISGGLAGFGGFWATGGSGSDLYTFPLLVTQPKLEGIPTLAYGVWQADVAKGSTLTINGHTYLALGNHMGGSGFAAGSASQSLLVRYE